MGDGRVALILDILGLAQRANMVTQSREHSVSEQSSGIGARGRGEANLPALFRTWRAHASRFH